MAVPAFLRNDPIRITNLKFINILEYSDDTFHCLSDANAFISLFLERRRVRLCQSDGMARTLQTSLLKRKSKVNKSVSKK